MYHYIQDKKYLKCLRSACSDVVNQLVQRINKDSVMTVKACLVGSGARNLITQNAKESVDLDYSLCIIAPNPIDSSGYEIKEYVRKQFNKVLKANHWRDCQDSRSVLTTQKEVLKQGDTTKFSMDLAITFQDDSGWYKLIHEKTGHVASDKYYWNKISDSDRLEEKVNAIKSNCLWNEVRDTYLKKKNLYLRRNDMSRPSFVVYIETVNQIYSKYVLSARK